MNKFLKVSTLALLFIAVSPIYAQRSNCGVSQVANTIVQANGSLLTIHGMGNEAISYLETENGYTVLLNKVNGNYEYAGLDASGNLVLSGVIASDLGEKQLQKTINLTPHLRYSHAQRSMLTQYFEEETRVMQDLGKAGANVFSSQGDRKVLVLMVQYPDLPATIPIENFQMLMNQPNNAGTGSFRDYYLQASKNRLRLTSDIYGWFTADSGYKYYGKTSSPSYSQATRKLLLGAINDADSVVDFAQYDSDSDGYVDAVILIHSGQGAEEASAPNAGNYIHSFRSTLSSTQTPTKDGKKFSAYCMFPEKLYNGGNYTIVGIGVIAHEFGHIIDLPDLYATGYSNAGAGNFTIMAAGTWLNNQKTPCMMDAFSRAAMGWGEPTVITEIGNYTIPYSIVDSNFAFRINTKMANEYFLLENRQNKGFDKYVPAKGLAVWHINSNKAGRLSQTGNNVNNDTSDLGVHLLQADGLRELERNVNNGNNGDLFPGTSNKKNLTPFTTPSTNLHKSYAATNIYITNITMNPDSSITFRFSSQPAAAFATDRIAGCVPFSVALTNNSTAASAFKWNFGNGQMDSTTLNPTASFTQPGSYAIKLNVYDSLGNLSDSSTMNIEAYPSPEASYKNIQNGNKLTLTNTSTGAVSVQWQYYIGATSYSSSSNILTDLIIPDTGKFVYKIIAFNNYGCADTAYGETHAFAVGLKENNESLGALNAYPNPFSESFRIQLQLAKATEIRFACMDILGNVITETVSEKYAAGNQTILFENVKQLGAGIYFLKVYTGSESKTIRLIKTE